MVIVFIIFDRIFVLINTTTDHDSLEVYLTLMDCRLVSVGEFLCFHDPESYTSWEFNLSGRFMPGR